MVHTVVNNISKVQPINSYRLFSVSKKTPSGKITPEIYAFCPCGSFSPQYMEQIGLKKTAQEFIKKTNPRNNFKCSGETKPLMTN